MTEARDSRSRRNSNGVAPRSSARAEATRQAILRAARDVFRQHGYVEANVGHIIEQCGISRGAFYYHFRNKDDVFGSLTIEAVSALGDRLYPQDAHEHPFQRIYNANYQYLLGFLEYSDIFWNLTQAANVSARVKSLERKLWHSPVSRIERHLRRELDVGRSRGLDPLITASALCGMLDAFCYRWFAVRHIDLPEHEVERVAHELSVIWYMAIYGNLDGVEQCGIPSMIRSPR